MGGLLFQLTFLHFMFLVFSDKCLNVTVQLLHSWDRLELLNKTKLEIYNKKNHFFTHDQFGRILKFTDTNFFSKWRLEAGKTATYIEVVNAIFLGSMNIFILSQVKHIKRCFVYKNQARLVHCWNKLTGKLVSLSEYPHRLSKLKV